MEDVVHNSSSPLDTKQLQRASHTRFLSCLLQDDTGVPLHVQSKKLILPLVLIQRLHHVHENHTGVEWALDLKQQLVQNFW